MLVTITQLSEQIRRLDRRIEQVAQSSYSETDVLRQVPGVGGLPALDYGPRTNRPAQLRVIPG